MEKFGGLCRAPRCCQQSRWAAGGVQLEDHGLNLVLRSALEDRITGCWASPAASCPHDGCCSEHFSAPRRLHLASERWCLLPIEVFPGCELSQPGPVVFLHLPHGYCPWDLDCCLALRAVLLFKSKLSIKTTPRPLQLLLIGVPRRSLLPQGPWMSPLCPGSHHGEGGWARTPRVPSAEPILICAHFRHLRSGFLPRPRRRSRGFGSAAWRGRQSTGTERGRCCGMAMSPPQPRCHCWKQPPAPGRRCGEEEPPAPCAAQLRPWQVAVAGGAARSGCR